MLPQTLQVLLYGHRCRHIGMVEGAHDHVPPLLSGSVLFPLGFLALPAHAVPGPPVLRGMLWAGCLWLALETLVAPLLGAGGFSAALGGFPAALRAEPKPVPMRRTGCPPDPHR
jgi:hypothetical protein